MKSSHWSVALSAALSLSAVAHDALAVEAGTPEVRLAESCVVDPEIWQEAGLIAWQNYCTGTLWIAHLNPETGVWLPDNGKGTFVAASVPSTDYTRNAAEWGFSQAGPELYFTQWSPRDGMEVAVASDVLSPRAKVTMLTRTYWRNQLNGIPFPSKDMADERPRIVYYHVDDRRMKLVWAEVENQSPVAESYTHIVRGGFIPDAEAVVYKGPRWIPGERAALVTRKVEGAQGEIFQVFRYDIDTLAYTQLTFEERPVLDAQILALKSGQRFLMATYDEEGVIVYREDADGAFRYETTLFLAGPEDPPRSVTLWEPFEYLGRPFVVGQIAEPEGPFTPSRLQVASALAADPFVQTVCGDEPGVVRFDPEAFVGTRDVFVYYYSPEDHSFARCETGLRARYEGAE